MKYRKKPVVVDVEKWTGTIGSFNDILDFMGTVKDRGVYLSADKKSLCIETLEGDMRAEIGDFIIKGVKGEFYPCKPDVFKETYDQI